MREFCPSFRAHLRLLASLACGATALLTAPALGQTGVAAPQFKPLDDAMTAFMQRWSLPGGAAAVTFDGKLVFVHGYGLADVEQRRPVEPDSLFRLGSVGKPITAAAIMKLVEQHRLTLDARMVDLVRDLVPPGSGEAIAPGVTTITVQNLLQHTSDWGPEEGRLGGMDISGILSRLNRPSPPWRFRDLLGVALTEPPRLPPGSHWEYSTFGYCVLGQIIERAAGRSFESVVRQQLLGPAGADGMRLARATRAEAWPREVAYYDNPSDPPFEERDASGHRIARPYAYWDKVEGCDLAGRWVSSLPDYMRFLLALTGRRGALLPPASLRLMDDRFSAIRENDNWKTLAGLGWSLYVTDSGDIGWAHSGGLPGSMAYVVHSFRGEDWMVAFNSRPAGSAAYGDLVRTISAALAVIRRVPGDDLFDRYPPSPPPR